MAELRKNIEYPRVWRRFERTLKDGSVKKFKVQDVPEDMFEDVITFYSEHFMNEEPFTVASAIEPESEDHEQMKKFWRHSILPQKLSLVCFEDIDRQSDEKPEIVGANLMMRVVKGRQFEEEFREPKKLYELLEELDRRINIFEAMNVDEFMGDRGLSVNPKYRGMNIGFEILLAREPLCKAIGVPTMETLFTSLASQKMAPRAGYKNLLDVNYRDLEESLNVKFPEGLEIAKVMVNVFK